ncbi:ATPase, T2SS/T4P/T4SS family [Haladaptatus salinisoli]|uniref:ATPase, T2SS/T4P/T4SS family n=1 Tax=Haladaptatus salinisoli TaxID=2884876 RepID=UPI001D0A9826|nr:ATPase, T2SS/T4P/T4SS family [Haladaptatus salinisoli]
MWNPLSKTESGDRDCRCEASFDGDALVVDASDCPGRGDLAERPPCRATVVDALADREADRALTRANGVERAYEGDEAAFLVAAGRFADRVAFYDDGLAARARRDPIRAGIDAAGRAGAVANVAAETGLAEGIRRFESYSSFRPFVAPTIARSRVSVRPPPNARLDDRYELSTGATVRHYDTDRARRTYHLEPRESAFDEDALETLDRAAELLASGGVSGGERASGRAVRTVAGEDDPVEALAAVLEKHTRGYGVLTDLFADPAVSDAFATAPVTENPLCVRANGEQMRTNVRLTTEGAASLASRFRLTSGRAFSRASPTLDAVANVNDTAVRVAGVTDPVSDGLGFAFRARSEETWTIPALVGNGTLPADAAAVLSLAVERAAAGLVAGTRGAGKTTLLGALLRELPAKTRTVVLEDTPELPVESLQEDGRDVQALRTTATDDEPGLRPADALRTALRLGEGALVVGEVRGEEASVLYEAMRVGASGSTVLGTIHGDGGGAVYERVVTDLGVPPSSFAATEFVVTLEPYEADETRKRRVKCIEEVVGDGEAVRFEPLYELDGGDLAPTGRIDRGNSALVASLADAAETYADVRAALAERTDDVEARVERANPDFAVTTTEMTGDST